LQGACRFGPKKAHTHEETSMTSTLRAFCAAALWAWGAASAPAAETKVLNIYNWTDYIAEDTIRNFEKETGIKVRYETYDLDEV
jgi:putrescine transport system substrate-binding protein